MFKFAQARFRLRREQVVGQQSALDPSGAFACPQNLKWKGLYIFCSNIAASRQPGSLLKMMDNTLIVTFLIDYSRKHEHLQFSSPRLPSAARHMPAMGRPGFAPDKGPGRQHEICQSSRQSLTGGLPPTREAQWQGGPSCAAASNLKVAQRPARPRLASPRLSLHKYKSAPRRLGRGLGRTAGRCWATLPAGPRGRGTDPHRIPGQKSPATAKGNQSFAQRGGMHRPRLRRPTLKGAVVLFDRSALRPELRAAAGVI